MLDASDNAKIRPLMEKLLAANQTTNIGAEFLTSQILVELLTEILFAAGAVNAAMFIKDKTSGLYSMSDIVSA